MAKKEIKKDSKKEVKEKKVRKVKKEKEVKKTKKDNLFIQIKKEMAKVHFPSKKDMIKYSIATIGFVIFFGIYFYVIQLVMAFVKSLI